MKTSTKTNLLALLLIQAGLQACSFGGGSGGGASSNPNPCVLSRNTNFADDEAQIGFSYPPQCPYVVKTAGTSLDFGFFLDVPTANLPLTARTGSSTIADYGNTTRYSGTFYFSDNTPYLFSNNRTGLRATISGSYSAGNAGAGGVIRDAFTVLYYSQRAQANSVGQLTLPGNVDPNHGSIVGPSDISIGQSNTWRIVPGWDTVSYQYAWDIDGSTIGTSATASGSVQSLGYFTLRGIAIRTDNTADTVTKTLSTYLHTPTISGPTQVEVECTNSWQAYPSGGVAPYTYEWTVNSVVYSTSAELQYTPTNAGTQYLAVKVTDSQASYQTGYLTFNVGSGNCS